MEEYEIPGISEVKEKNLNSLMIFFGVAYKMVGPELLGSMKGADGNGLSGSYSRCIVSSYIYHIAYFSPIHLNLITIGSFHSSPRFLQCTCATTLFQV
jgi:hypothetical protein